MSTSTEPHTWADWVGRTQEARQPIDPLAVAALAATLDLAQAPVAGDALPAGWQWLFFNPIVRTAELGVDGHPRRDLADSFLPPVPLPRRMWAGSRIQYVAPLRVGAQAERQSRILRVEPKQGRAGRMCFVTVEHTVRDDGRTCIVEQQDIVYREGTTATAPPATSAAAPPAATPADDAAAPWPWRRPMRVGPTLLFRYSALTFNGHRIHYDQPYARDVENYAGLVVHGPLTATLLQGFAAALRPQTRLQRFDFRGVSPLYADEPFELQGRDDPQAEGTLSLQVVGADGRVVMQATAGWSGA